MTPNGDTMTTTPTAAAGDALLAAVRAYLLGNGDPQDVDQAFATLADTLPSTEPGTVADLRNAVDEVLGYYQFWIGKGDANSGRLLSLGRCYQIAAAIDRAVAPFPKVAELRAAEQALIDAERAAAQALNDLEQAVADHDVDRVMKLRGEVEVGHPGRIAAAKKTLLRLQIEQALAQTEPGKARAAAANQAVTDAQQRLDDLARQVKAAETELRGRFGDRDGARAAVRELETSVMHLTAQLDELEASHARDTEARLRRIAGLPDKPDAEQADAEQPTYQSPIVERVQPPLSGDSMVLSPGAARHIDAPALDFSASQR